jgi:hypothetical protein
LPQLLDDHDRLLSLASGVDDIHNNPGQNGDTDNEKQLAQHFNFLSLRPPVHREGCSLTCGEETLASLGIIRVRCRGAKDRRGQQTDALKTISDTASSPSNN